MSKFLKFIVHFVIICTIAIVLGLALPPFFGVKTVIVDNKNKETNLAMGSVTYAIPVKTETVNAGAPILVQDGEGTYRYNLVSVDRQTNTGVAIDPEAAASENINVSVKNWVPKVVVTVPLIGYLMAATESTEGIIVLALAVLFLIILYVIAELWKKPETLDEYEDLQGDRRYLKTQKELKMEEKAREKRMQEEDRELLYGEKDRRKRAKKEEKERRKKIRTGGFVDEIYEDDLEEERPVRRQERSGVRPENMQAATSEAHELLKKEIAAATAEEAAAMEIPADHTEELPSFRELQEERARMKREEEEWEEEEAPVEIKKMAMPVWTASQLADKAKREGDAPDIVRDSITKVTFLIILISLEETQKKAKKNKKKYQQSADRYERSGLRFVFCVKIIKTGKSFLLYRYCFCVYVMGFLHMQKK